MDVGTNRFLGQCAIPKVGAWGTMFFKKKLEKKTYDKLRKKPVIKASICTGEQVAGFKDLSTGAFEEVMLIKGPEDLALFREMYGIAGEIEKIY